jgi:hypothetical protein
MITITTTTQHKPRCEAFTLVEVLIGAILGTMVLAGVMSTFLMLGRSGANIANYSMMETQSRRALEELSQDLRMANNVTWNSPQSITLLVPDTYTSLASPVTYVSYTYAYDSATKEFYRKAGVASASTPRTILVRSVASCVFARFDRLNNATTNPLATKRIQLTLVAERKSQTVAAATNTILSASYILRNRLVN